MAKVTQNPQELREEIAELRGLIRDMIDSSEGLHGFPNPGDFTPWSEFQPGAKYEAWMSVYHESCQRGLRHVS